MKPTTKEKVKKFLTPLVESIMREEESTTMLDSQDLKVILAYVNALASAPTLSHHINDRTLKDLDDKIRGIRIEMMRYVTEHSDVDFYGKSPSGWKYVKKKK